MVIIDVLALLISVFIIVAALLLLCSLALSMFADKLDREGSKNDLRERHMMTDYASMITPRPVQHSGDGNNKRRKKDDK